MISFVKMEATGNDYIYFDAFQEGRQNPGFSAGEIISLSHRRFGIGGDGVVVISRSQRALARMWMWNADGSSSDMCGNALRSVAFLVYKWTGKREFILESGSGLHNAKIVDIINDNNGYVEVEMGPPKLGAGEVPLILNRISSDEAVDGCAIDREASREVAENFRFTAVSMGNPHMVIFREGIRSLDLDSIGPPLENHPAFTERTNVEFVELENDGTLSQRTFERGSGETLSCGSGACATLVASVLTGRGPRKNTIHLRGGDLNIEWREASAESRETIILRGPVRIVFEGELERSNLLDHIPEL